MIIGASLVMLQCQPSPIDSRRPIPAEMLAEEYERSSAAVRTRFDGREITIRGYAELAAVMPAPDADQGSVQLEDKESQSAGRVVCWEQSENFSQLKGGQYITVRGVFNGEGGADLKFCKLVGVE